MFNTNKAHAILKKFKAIWNTHTGSSWHQKLTKRLTFLDEN